MNRSLRSLIAAFTALAFLVSSVGVGMAGTMASTGFAAEHAVAGEDESECHPGHLSELGDIAQSIKCAALASSDVPVKHHDAESNGLCCATNCNVALPATCYTGTFSVLVSEARAALPDSLAVESLATSLDRPPRSTIL